MKNVIFLGFLVLISAGNPTRAPRGEIKSFQQIFDEIPADQRPPKGRDWEGIGAQLANEWIMKNTPGRIFHGRVTIRDSVKMDHRDYGKLIWVNFQEEEKLPSGAKGSTTALFLVKYAEDFRKLKKGDKIEISGKIEAVDTTYGLTFTLAYPARLIPAK